MALAKAEERQKLQTLRSAEGTSVFSADNNSSAPSVPPQTQPSSLSADNKPADSRPQGAVKPPTQRQQATGSSTPEGAAAHSRGEDAGQPRGLPYHDAFPVVTHLRLKTEPAAFVHGALVWLRLLREQQPAEYSALLHEPVARLASLTE